MAPRLDTTVFRRFRPLTLALAALLGLHVVINAVYLVLCTGVFVSSSPNVLFNDDGQPSILIRAMAMAGSLEISLFWITVVIFLIWVYRAYKNLIGLGADGLSSSPGWAVGSWFVPVVNIFKPYQIMQEIWTNSDPDYEEEFGFLSEQGAGTSLVGYWWGTYLVSNVTAYLAQLSNPLSDGNLFFSLIAFYAAIRIVASVLALKLILGTENRQMKRFERLLRSGLKVDELPPEPPTFYREA